ncbi:MAG: SRPBCC domain-containing protein, partial [Pseudolysinimonas sp.]
IRATPERIWQAITDPEQTQQYFHGAKMSVTAEHMHSEGPDGSSWGDSAVEVFDPPRKLVYGWSSLYDPEMAVEPASRVTFEIEEVGSGVCKLTLLHDRLDGSPKTALSVSGEGWMFVLSNLKSWLETGEALQLAS